jgi:hypothetical protein
MKTGLRRDAMLASNQCPINARNPSQNIPEMLHQRWVAYLFVFPKKKYLKWKKELFRYFFIYQSPFLRQINQPLLFHPLPSINQPIRRAIKLLNCAICPQLWQNRISQLFAQFNAPLIKTKYIPNDTLHENFMFIKSD